MKPLNLVVTLLFLISALPFMAAQGSTSSNAPAPATSTAPAIIDEKAEAELVALINQARAAQDLPLLTLDSRLRDTARFHSTFMQSAGRIGYEFPGEPKIHARMGMMNVLEDQAAENVSIALDLKAAHEGLLAAEATRTNVMSNRYNVVGVAVLRQGDRLYIVEDFARLLDEKSVPEVETAVANGVNEARRQKKITPITYTSMPSLRAVSCKMARRNQVDPNAAPVVLNTNVDVNGTNTGGMDAKDGMASFTVTFTTFHPNEPPESVLKNTFDPRWNVVSVGACFLRSESYPQGTYWVTLLLYHKQNFR